MSHENLTIHSDLEMNAPPPGPALPPAPAQTVIAVAHTGDYRKDVLLENLDYRWNRTQQVGSAVTVTYSFAAAAPAYGDAEDIAGFMSFGAYERQLVRDIFTKISSFTRITFNEVSDSRTSYGQIRFSMNEQVDSAGYAYFPFSNGTPLDGDVFISVDAITGETSYEADYGLMAHEIFHALGLKHPGNYNAGENLPANATGNFLGQAEDSLAYTTMSYREVAQGQQSLGGIYDILTLQYLYGARLSETGDSTYTLTDARGEYLDTLIDGGGVDRINLASVTTGAVVDLREGAFSSIGLAAPGVPAINNIAIAFGSKIENVTGTNFADSITGNGLANSLTGGVGVDRLTGLGGNDILDGGSGFDVAVYTGARSGYTVTNSGGGRIISDSAPGRDATDTLSEVERAMFSDGVLAFDNLRTDMAGKGYLLYRAAFNRVPDAAGLGYWIGELDRGADYGSVVAASFIASPEFIATYGVGIENNRFVDLIYQNVLGRTADAEGSAYWLGQLAGGFARSNMLASFAISDENYNSVSPLISDGIWFV